MGTLVSLIERAADLLAPIDGLHWRRLLASAWMATDGTGLKVLIPGLPKAHNGYLELYRNQELAVFQYSPDKNGDRVAAMLRPFRGKLTADAESCFNVVFASSNVIETGCNAHGRRKFRDAEESQAGARRGRRRLPRRDLRRGEKAQTAGLTGGALRDNRQKHIAPLVADFKKWMTAVEPTLLPSEPLAAAIRYYTNHCSSPARAAWARPRSRARRR